MRPQVLRKKKKRLKEAFNSLESARKAARGLNRVFFFGYKQISSGY